MAGSTIGSINIDIKADTQKLVKGFERAEKNISKTTRNMTRNIIGLTTTYLSLNAANEKILKTGLEYNRSIEEQTASIKTLLAATSSNIDSLGRQITIQQKYSLAGKESIAIMTQLEAINAKTPNTLSETAKIYKTMLPSMRAAGATQKDLITLTEKLSIAANAGGVEFNSLLAGVDGLASGTVLANSDLGRFLSGIGLTNETLKKSKDVVKTLVDGLSEFKALDTIAVATSNLNVEWQKLTGSLTKDIFGANKEGIKALSEEFKKINANKEDLEAIRNVLNDMASALVTGISFGIRAVNGIRLTYEDLSYFITQSIATGSLLIDELKVKFMTFTRDIRASIVETIGFEKANLLGIDTDFNAQTKAIAKVQSVIGKTNKELQENHEAWQQIKNDGLKFNDVILNIETTIKKSLGSSADEIDNLEDRFSKLLSGGKTGSLTVKTETVEDDVFQSSAKNIEEYYLLIGDYQTAWLIHESSLKEKWIGLTAEQYTKAAAIAKTEYFDKLKDTELNLNLTLTGWDDASNAIAKMGNGFNSLQKDNEKYQKDKKKYAKNDKKLAKLESNNTKDQLSNYSSIASGASKMFDEKTTAYKAFHSLEVGLNAAKMAMMITEMAMENTQTAATVANANVSTLASFKAASANAAESVTNAGKGDPYTAPARVALMIGLMAGAMTMFGGSVSGTGSVPDYSSTIESASFNDNTGVSLSDYDNNFDKFIEGLDSASEKLEQFGNVGSAISLTIQAQLAEISKFQALTTKDAINSSNQNQVQLQYDDSGDLSDASFFFQGQWYSTSGLTNQNTRADAVARLNELITPNYEAQIIAIQENLAESLKEEVSANLDFEVFSENELKSLTGISNIEEFNDSYADIVHQINSIGVEIKNAQINGLSEDDINKLTLQLTELYTLPTNILGQDYEEAIDLLTEMNEAREDERKTLQEEYDLLIGATTEREVELAAIDDTNKALQKLIWQEEDRQEQLEEEAELIEALNDTFTSLSGTVSDTIDALTASDNEASTQTDLIQDFWKKRNEANALLAKSTALTEDEQSNLTDLISDVNSLATSINASGGETITGELISVLGDLETNLSDEILSVNIVGISNNLDLLSQNTAIAPTVSTGTPSTSNAINLDSKDVLNSIYDKIAEIADSTKSVENDVDAIVNNAVTINTKEV